MTDFDEFRGHTIIVETATGATGMGQGYATPVTYGPNDLTGVLVDESRKLVRDAQGNEVISETTVWDPELAHVSTYTPNSKVTLPSGRVATVIIVAANDGDPMNLPSVIEVNLT